MSHFNKAVLRARLFAVPPLIALTGCQFNTPRTATPPASTPAPTTSASPVRFAEVAEKAGLHYAWKVPGKRPFNILQTIGNGCAFLDYNNDGNLDILLVGPKLALFTGNGKGQFQEVSQEMGLSQLKGHFLGCGVGDYDNDGWSDVYLSGYRTGLLLHNEKGQRFRDVTVKAGMQAQPWGTSCAWADVDGDGRLDLFVANYVHFGPQPDIPQLCNSHGIMGVCAPRFYKPLKGVLYRNLGQGRFIDASALLNLKSTNGAALGAAFAPLSGHGSPTLAIANDEQPGDLMSPIGKANALRYINAGSSSGTAYDRDGNVHGGMGTDWGDYDSDGRLDLFITTFQSETKSLYHNDGRGIFSDTSYLTGLAMPTLMYVAFGCKWFDPDNDGWLDLMIANGHVQDNIHDIDTSATYRQKTQLFHNPGGPRPVFKDVSEVAGTAFERPILGRGLSVGDYDNDGRVDALVVDSEGKPLLLHNQTNPVGHWLSVQLQGTKSNREGIGALVTVTVGKRKLVRHCHTDGSYLSASDRRVQFGLGAATVVDTLIIRWPSGHTDTLRNVAVNRHIIVREGSLPSSLGGS